MRVALTALTAPNQEPRHTTTRRDPLDMNHPEDTPHDGCPCECHDIFDPDGLLCVDGHCDTCGDRAGSGNPDGPRTDDEAEQ